MRKLATSAIVALAACLSIASPAVARPALEAAHHPQHHRGHHHPGCLSHGCDRRIDHYVARWILAHRRVTITRFDLCVANQENGEPGATTFSTVNWHADNNYEGAFSWEHSKWEAGGGLRYAQHPYEASPENQVAVFHQNGRNGEWTLQNWPTIARC